MSLRKLEGLIRGLTAAIIIIPATLVIGTLAIITTAFRPEAEFVNWLTRAWGKTIVFATGMIVTVIGHENIQPRTPYIVVSNHLSDLDIGVHLAITKPASIRFLAKKELFGIIFFGRLLRAIGCIETDRAAGRQAHQEINRQIAETIGLGHSLMIYAEGTRSRDGSLQEFKKGAFRIAIDNQMDVLPMTIHGTYQAWEPETPYMYGGPVTVIVHEAISVQGLTPVDITRLRNETHEIVRADLVRLGVEPAEDATDSA